MDAQQALQQAIQTLSSTVDATLADGCALPEDCAALAASLHSLADRLSTTPAPPAQAPDALTALRQALACERRARSHAEQTAEQTFQMLEQVLRSISDTILVYSEEQTLLFSNRAAGGGQPPPLNLQVLFKRAQTTGQLVGEEYFCPQTSRWIRVSMHASQWFGHPRAYLVIMHDITEHKRREERILQQARTDCHTGVYNRTGGLTLLRELLQDAEQYPLCICFVDIDFLKDINDRFGHSEGDALIQTVAHVIKTSIRSMDLVVRMGGDEFLIVLPMIRLASAKRAINRMMDALCKRLVAQNKPYTASFSCGIEEVQNIRSSPLEELISQADRRMYEMKRQRHAQRQLQEG